MQFELSLADVNGASTRRMTTLHLMLAFVLCGLGAGCLVLYWFTATSPKFATAYQPFAVFGICSFLAGGTIAAVSVFYRNWLMQGKRNIMLRVAEILIISTACLLFALAGQMKPAGIFGIVAVMITIATFWEAGTPRVQQVTISERGISLPKKGMTQIIGWKEIESILLRHSILTIELTGNRLLQRSVITNETDTQGIEAFSKELIQQHEKERTTNAAW